MNITYTHGSRTYLGTVDPAAYAAGGQVTVTREDGVRLAVHTRRITPADGGTR